MIRILSCLLLVLLVTGCTDIQTAGPVQEVPLGPEQLGVQIAPEPPQPGVSPVRLVEGFVQAMADSEADYAVAREYLTSQASKEWVPQDGGAVYKGVVGEDGDAVFVTGTRTGVLDERGRFTAVSDELVHDFGVVMVDGEWRISAPPAGLLVSDYIFERYWSHATVYFMASGGEHVVPDVVHVPDAYLTPSRIVEAQIAGPGDAIAGSVYNAIGSGVRLAAEGASVDATGTATVALTGLSEDMPDDRRRQLGAQLLWSLTAIPRVTGLRITNDGENFALPGQAADGVLQLALQQGFQQLSRAATSDLFGVRDGVAGRIGPAESFLPMSSGDKKVAEVAVSVDATLVGFIDQPRTQLMVGPLGGQLAEVPTEWSNLRSAQFSLGHLWVIGDDAAGRTGILRVDAQGTVTVVDAGSVPGAIVDFSITQAGVRIGMVVERSGARRLVMGSLVQDTTLRLESVMEVPLVFTMGARLTGYRSLDWSGEVELGVVADSSSGTSVFRALLDGSGVEDLGPLSETPAQLTALPRLSSDAVVVRAADGSVLRYDVTSRWSRMKLQLEEVSYPG